MRHSTLVFLALVSLFADFAWAAKNDLSIGIIQEWSAFNPITNQLASNEALFPLIIRRMVRRTVDGSVLPDVAEKVPALKNEGGKFIGLWSIRKNAKWGDGQLITCKDWHLGWQVGLNPKVSAESRTLYTKIENIEWSEKTPQNCRVTYANGDWSYERELPPLLPAHVEKAAYDKFQNEPEGYDRNTNYISNPTNKALYNGPYVVSEFKLGSHVILVRNPFFYGTQPKIERVMIKLISDTSALKANLSTQGINAISAVGFPPDTALLFDEEFKKSNEPYTVHFQDSGIFQGIYFNLDREIFKDVKVREALSRAIDKEAIVKAFFNNKLLAAESILSPLHPAYTKMPPIYSVAKANKLLDEAGWKQNGKNVREKNGKPLSFVFKTSAGLKVLENIQVYVCEKFKAIGAQCVIKNEPPRALLGQSVPHGEFDLAMYGNPIPADTSLTSRFSSQEIPTEKNSWAGANAIRLASPVVDKMLADFDKENNKQNRNKIAKKLELYLQANYHMIPLYHRREAIVMPKTLKGVTPSFEGTGYNMPENWVF